MRAAQNHWRYGIIKEPNEALVMYLDLPAFIEMPYEAIPEADSGAAPIHCAIT